MNGVIDDIRTVENMTDRKCGIAALVAVSVFGFFVYMLYYFGFYVCLRFGFGLVIAVLIIPILFSCGKLA